MAITIGSTLLYRNLRMELVGTGSANHLIKTTKLNGAMINSDVVALLTAFFNISNCGLITGTVDGYPIAGAPSAVSALQDLVSAMAVIAFSRSNPVNSAKTITKNFV